MPKRSAKTSSKTSPHNDLLNEAAVLAKTFGAALKEYKDSPAIRRAAEGALKDLKAVGRDLSTAIGKTRQAPANAALEAKVKKVVDLGRTKADKAFGKYRKSLASGLGSLGRQLTGLSDRLKK